MSRWMSAARLCAVLTTLAVVLPAAPVAAAPVVRGAGFYCTWADGHGGLGTFRATAPFSYADQRGTAPVDVNVTDAYERLQELGVASVDGTATLALRISDGDVTFRTKLDVPVPKTSTSAGTPTVLDFAKDIPALTDAQGAVVVWLESATLDLFTYDADDFPTPVAGRATSDVNGAPVEQPDDPTAFRVPCSDVDNPTGAVIATFLAGDEPYLPLTPPAYVSIEPGAGTLALDWSPAAGTFPVRAYSFEVIREDGPFAGESTTSGVPGAATGKILSALGTGRAYRVIGTVSDVNGSTAEFFDSGTIRTLSATPAPITRVLTATATVNLPRIAKRPFTLSGTANLTATGVGHAVTGTFDFQPVLTRLTVGSGALPISSKVTLVRSGPATGTFTNGLLNLAQSVRLKVLDAKAFGAVPIALGNDCQTKELSKLALSSGSATSGSWPISFAGYGGKVASRFPVSDLNGCAVISADFDPAAASTGDISVSLAPAP